jgi:3-oxoacyl-[acyl-carrier-protein] synthase-3
MSEFAARAGRDALARAGLDASDLDLVVVATSTADEITPNAAPLVAGLIGADRAGAFDVGSACTGWLAGLALACGQIESGRAAHALVVGADFLSRFLDLSDRDTAPLFADGAGAAVISVTTGPSGRVGPVLLRSDSEGAELIRLERSGRIRMRGQETFRAAVGSLASVTVQALERAGVELDEIDLFVYHQANRASSAPWGSAWAYRRIASSTTSSALPTLPRQRFRSRCRWPSVRDGCIRAIWCCWPRSAAGSRGVPRWCSGACLS